MTRRSGVPGVPADYLTGPFPDGALGADAPVPVGYAQAVALALREALRQRSLSAVCREAGLARSTVQDLLGGRTWPDLVTLAKLEAVLDQTLWPSRSQLSDRAAP